MYICFCACVCVCVWMSSWQMMMTVICNRVVINWSGSSLAGRWRWWWCSSALSSQKIAQVSTVESFFESQFLKVEPPWPPVNLCSPVSPVLLTTKREWVDHDLDQVCDIFRNFFKAITLKGNPDFKKTRVLTHVSHSQVASMWVWESVSNELYLWLFSILCVFRPFSHFKANYNLFLVVHSNSFRVQQMASSQNRFFVSSLIDYSLNLLCL